MDHLPPCRTDIRELAAHFLPTKGPAPTTTTKIVANLRMPTTKNLVISKSTKNFNKKKKEKEKDKE